MLDGVAIKTAGFMIHKIEDINHMRFSLREHDSVDNERTIIHETAIQRAITGAHRYAPIGISPLI